MPTILIEMVDGAKSFLVSNTKCGSCAFRLYAQHSYEQFDIKRKEGKWIETKFAFIRIPLVLSHSLICCRKCSLQWVHQRDFFMRVLFKNFSASFLSCNNGVTMYLLNTKETGELHKWKRNQQVIDIKI